MDIAVLAKEMARAGLRGVWRWSGQDYEDASQEAALHIHQAMQRRPEAGSGYYARAGYKAARGWVAAQARSLDSQRVLAGFASTGLNAERRGWHDGKPWDEPLSDARAAQIANLLAKGRRKPETALRDACILQSLSRGLTQKEIGDEMGLSRWHVGVLRQRIRKALSAYQEA